MVALCSASLRLSKSLVELCGLGGKFGLDEKFFIGFEDCLETKDLLKLLLGEGLFVFFSITTVFFT